MSLSKWILLCFFSISSLLGTVIPVEDMEDYGSPNGNSTTFEIGLVTDYGSQIDHTQDFFMTEVSGARWLWDNSNNEFRYPTDSCMIAHLFDVGHNPEDTSEWIIGWNFAGSAVPPSNRTYSTIVHGLYKFSTLMPDGISDSTERAIYIDFRDSQYPSTGDPYYSNDFQIRATNSTADEFFQVRGYYTGSNWIEVAWGDTIGVWDIIGKSTGTFPPTTIFIHQRLRICLTVG